MHNEKLAMIEEFAENDWDISQVFEPSDISKRFNWSNKTARYYAGLLVDRGILCNVKIDGFIYYTKACWYIQLRKYSVLDNVKVI